MREVLAIVLFLASFVTIPESSMAALRDGVLLVHHPATYQYSPGHDCCDLYASSHNLAQSEDQNPRIDLDGSAGKISLWYVIAAWPEEESFSGIEFGFGSYDPAAYFFTDAQCCLANPVELSTSSWPGPLSGTRLSATDSAWTGGLVPVYSFLGYAYSEATIPLSGCPPSETALLGSSQSPSHSYPVVDHGSLGLFTDGARVCPVASDPGAPDLFVSSGVIPHQLNPAATEHSFLLSEPPGMMGLTVSLLLGDESHSCQRSQYTTSRTSLWTVTLSDIDTTRTPVLQIDGQTVLGDVHRAVTMQWHGDPFYTDDHTISGQIDLVTMAGALGFPPGERWRDPSELSPDPSMAWFLSALHVSAVKKSMPSLADTCTVVFYKGAPKPIPAALQRTYEFTIPASLSPTSVAAMLRLSPSIDRVFPDCNTISLESRSIPSECSDFHLEDGFGTYGPQLWSEFGDSEWPYAQEICDAWGDATGAGVAISLVDVPLHEGYGSSGGAPQSSSSPYEGGTFPVLFPKSPPQDSEYHSTWMASLAAGDMGHGIRAVGVAPDAEIVPFSLISASVNDGIDACIAAYEWTTPGCVCLTSFNLDTSGERLEDLRTAFGHALRRGVILVGPATGPFAYPSQAWAHEMVSVVGCHTGEVEGGCRAAAMMAGICALACQTPGCSSTFEMIDMLQAAGVFRSGVFRIPMAEDVVEETTPSD